MLSMKRVSRTVSGGLGARWLAVLVTGYSRKWEELPLESLPVGEIDSLWGSGRHGGGELLSELKM